MSQIFSAKKRAKKLNTSYSSYHCAPTWIHRSRNHQRKAKNNKTAGKNKHACVGYMWIMSTNRNKEDRVHVLRVGGSENDDARHFQRNPERVAFLRKERGNFLNWQHWSTRSLVDNLRQIFFSSEDSWFICIGPSDVEMPPERRRRLAYPVDTDSPCKRDTDDDCLLFLSTCSESRNNRGVKRFLLGVPIAYTSPNKYGCPLNFWSEFEDPCNRYCAKIIFF